MDKNKNSIKRNEKENNVKRTVLEEYRRPEDKMLLAQILDKIEQAEKRNQVEVTDFLDMYQIDLVRNFLRKIEYKNYQLKGGFEQAERKVLVVNCEKESEEIQNILQEELKIIRIILPKEEIGKYEHRNYLGGIIKVGMKREKVGDILVGQDGADMIVKKESIEMLKQELSNLTRFEKAKIEIKEIKDLRKVEIRMEELKIIVPSLRLDNFVSDLAKTSRSKAAQIIASERVFINGQNETKVSKQIKMGDILTIRGKGRFIIKGVTGTTRSGRNVVLIEKYSS